MADNVDVTPGTGKTFATDDIGGVQYPRAKLTWGPDGTANDTDVASGKPMPFQLRGSAGGDVVKLEDGASADGDPGVPMLAVRKGTPANTSGTDGDYEFLQMSAGRLWASTVLTDGTDTALIDANGSLQVLLKDSTGASVTYDIGVKPMNFAVASTTLTRPVDTTAYSINDSVSNNGTAGSVTALSATVSDTNDAPVNLTHIVLDTNDAAIGAATVSMRVYVYNSDPTASSGVGGGNNATFSNKKAGLVATFIGTFTAMSDGGKCVCIPESGVPYVVTKPSSGAKLLYVQHQFLTVTGNPTASTTIDTTLCGFQGRAT